MKGQYRIIMEVMLFGLGILIASFVLVSFQGLQKNSDIVAERNQMEGVLNSVLNGIVKASLMPNSIVRINIPTTLSGRTYRIFVDNSKNLTIMDFKDNTINATREIFNIDVSNRIAGDVVSGAGVVEINYNGASIIMQRG